MCRRKDHPRSFDPCPSPYFLPLQRSALGGRWPQADVDGFGAGCQWPGYSAQRQLDVCGSDACGKGQPGRVDTIHEKDMQQLCLQPTGRYWGGGAQWIQQGSGYSSALMLRHWGEGS